MTSREIDEKAAERAIAAVVKAAEEVGKFTVLGHLRQWAEERLKVACGLMRSSTIQRQRWQQRGRAEIARDLLHHLDTLQKDGSSTPHIEEPGASEPPKPEGVPEEDQG